MVGIVGFEPTLKGFLVPEVRFELTISPTTQQAFPISLLRQVLCLYLLGYIPIVEAKDSDFHRGGRLKQKSLIAYWGQGATPGCFDW